MADETTTSNNPVPQEPPPAPEPSVLATVDIAPIEMPLGAPEAPKAEPVSESPNIPVNTGVAVEAEPEKTPENIVISEPQPQTAPASAPPTPEATEEQSEATAGTQTAPEQTAQIPSNEPLPTTPEPTVAEPPKEEPKETTPEAIIPAKSLALKLLIKAREAIQFRKRKKLDHLMSLFLKKSQITNDDVEKLLHVSDATVTRYLSILEKEGKIKQSGKTGKGVSYSRI